MPAVSQAQRRFLYATKGAAWVHLHHFDNPGKLPARKRKKRRAGQHAAQVDAILRRLG
ncbi:MAG TPA: hypothetical protein VFP21_01205 [Solirubrobacterales bacterium]|nr:hypothetical protein [Solirubrobacterales bacterium]